MLEQVGQSSPRLFVLSAQLVQLRHQLPIRRDVVAVYLHVKAFKRHTPLS